MLVTRPHKFFTASTAKTPKFHLKFWFGLSLVFALFYSFLELQQAFSHAYVVQDDVRVYVSWMQQFLDLDLLPNDLLSSYFKSVTPFGFTTFYRLFAFVGIEPLLFSKLLPVCLKLLTTCYCFSLSLQIFPFPAAGFITTLLLNQNLSLRDDLVSATPRSFIYLLLIAFLYYLVRRALLPCLGAIALMGLFYPPFLLILAGILILNLWRWEGKLPSLSQNRLDYVFGVTGVGLALILMLPYALSSSEFGPIITGVEARALPAFSETGRIPFFDDNPFWFWLFGQHSGLIPNVILHPLSLVGLLLPILLRYPNRFPLGKQVASNISLLPRIALASVIMFFAAHVLLYKLFAPARYTRYTLRFVIILAAGIALVMILDAIFRWAKQQSQFSTRRQFLALGFTVSLGTLLILFPHIIKDFPTTNYIVGKAPTVYKFFQQQPKDILIASLSKEADNLPTFSQRSILVGWEYAVPYHVGYDRQIRQRATDLIHAQYSEDLAEVQSFIQKYKVDFFLLDRSAFTPKYIRSNRWFRQWQSIAKDILAMLNRGTTPALVGTIERCSVLQTEELIVLQAECLNKAA
jgi:hypothetical protein